MTVINSNSAALRAMNGSRLANSALQTAMARLSSGNRINSAADDAAGLAISNSMTSQINGMSQAISNANDGISLAQTADGALSEVTNNLQRIRELAVQSASGTYSDSDRANMQTEVSQLTAEISGTLDDTAFNGNEIFNTSGVGVWSGPGNNPGPALNTSAVPGTSTAIQTGSNAGDTVKVEVAGIPKKLNVESYETGTLTAPIQDEAAGTHTVTTEDFLAGAVVGGSAIKFEDIGTIKAQTVGDAYFLQTNKSDGVFSLGLPVKQVNMHTAFSVSNATQANATIGLADSYLNRVETARAGLGASESQLNSVVNNLANNVTNLTDAKSRISDADFSVETTNLARAQILGQASTAMLAQANQSAQSVLKLLQQ